MQSVELYKPYPHQRIVHDAITKYVEEREDDERIKQRTFSINSMRQVGKTTLAGNELIRFALLMPKCESIYISPTFELARKMLAEFSKSLTGTPFLDSINKSERTVTFFNKHVVRCLSAEQGDNLRGLNVSGLLIIDEFAYIRDAFINDVVYPFTDFHGAPTIAISTPRGRRGKHWEYQRAAAEGDPMYTAFDWAKFDMTHLHTMEWLDAKRRSMPERTFRTDYLGEFLENEGSIFTHLNNVLMPNGYVPSLSQLTWGIDWASGSGNDRTIITAFNEYNEQVILKEWHSCPPMRQVEEISAEINKHKHLTRSVVVERNGIGAVYIDALKRMLHVGVTPFTTTNESKRKAVDNVVMLMEKSEMKLINKEAQISEFEYFESSTTPNGSITYAAPSMMHDDYVMAVCFALSGKNNKSSFII